MIPQLKIISGGQTGADRAALDFAVQRSLSHGGWIPKGRLAEDGPLNKKYNLKETRTSDYEERTEKNVVDSDATIVFCRGELSGGSLFTLILAQKHNKPVLVIDLAAKDSENIGVNSVDRWIRKNNVCTLNVAGPRASKDSKMYQDVRQHLNRLFP